MSLNIESAEFDPALDACAQLEVIHPSEDAAAQATETDQPSDQTPKPLTGYELVSDMMRRQDEVIAELDSLNSRIELAIEEISAARKLEQDQQADDETAAAATESLPLKHAA